MRLTDAQYERIAPMLPTPRGKSVVHHRQVMDARSLDSKIIKLHADGSGAPRKRIVAWRLTSQRPDLSPRLGEGTC